MNLINAACRALAALGTRVRGRGRGPAPHALPHARARAVRSPSLPGLAVAIVVGALLVSALGEAQQQRSSGRPATPPTGGHEAHGTPPGWRFSWPKGEPARGREAFVKFECFSCHEVKGEAFPAPTDPQTTGPELASMAAVHDDDFLAESIINPDAVIEKGQGYEAADGSSKMPSFNDSMTVQEAIDLVAFLRSLKPPPGPARPHRH
jgi:mono/diheme cytochrome c family protein